MSFVRKATSNRVFSADLGLANNYVLATALLCNHRAITEVDTSVNAIIVTYWDWHQMCSFWRVEMESRRKKCESCNIWPPVLFYKCFPIANRRENNIDIGNRILTCALVWIIIVTFLHHAWIESSCYRRITAVGFIVRSGQITSLGIWDKQILCFNSFFFHSRTSKFKNQRNTKLSFQNEEHAGVWKHRWNQVK